MDWTFIEPIVYLAWLAGAVAFVLGLIRMNSPATARNGNLLSGRRHGPRDRRDGRAPAVQARREPEAEACRRSTPSAGSSSSPASRSAAAFGLYTARTVKMTAMPQLVSLFNAVGGGAAALIAIDDYLEVRRRAARSPASRSTSPPSSTSSSARSRSPGSLIASGKLDGPRITPSRPVMIPGRPARDGARWPRSRSSAAVYLWAGNVSLPVIARHPGRRR